MLNGIMLVAAALPKLINKISEKGLRSYALEGTLGVLWTLGTLLLLFKFFFPVETIIGFIFATIIFVIIDSIGITLVVKFSDGINIFFFKITERPARTFDNIVIARRRMKNPIRSLFKFRDAEVGLMYFIEKEDINHVSNVTFFEK